LETFAACRFAISSNWFQQLALGEKWHESSRMLLATIHP